MNPKNTLSNPKNRLTLVITFFILALAILTNGDFISARNFTNLTRQISVNGIVACGMTLVILTGGIDLSVGSVVAFCGIIIGLLQVNVNLAAWSGWAAFPATLICVTAALLSGTAWGALNGGLIVKSKVTPFIITLGMMVIVRGLALLISNGSAIAPFNDAFNVLGQGYLPDGVSKIIVGLSFLIGAFFIVRSFGSIVGERRPAPGLDVWLSLFLAVIATATLGCSFLSYRGIPCATLIFAIVALISHFLLERTVLGRHIVAAGSNPQAAFLAGLPVQKITFFVYSWLGLLTGLSSVILCGRLNGAMPTAGDLFELDAIAAVVIGGTRLTGGVGSITGTLGGVLLIGMMNNGMSLMNLNEFYQKMIKGLIIILAVWLDMRGRAKR